MTPVREIRNLGPAAAGLSGATINRGGVLHGIATRCALALAANSGHGKAVARDIRIFPYAIYDVRHFAAAT